MRRLFLLACLLALAVPATAGAAAPGWTTLTSNTTEDILAVEHQGDRAWFTTANGKIFRLVAGSWQQEHSAPGISLYDIEFRGNIGLAGGSAGKVYRSADGGDTWSALTMPMSTTESCGTDLALGDVRKLAFASDLTVYVFGDTNQVMKSANAGASFTKFNDPGPNCATNYGSPITGAFFVPGSSPITGYLMTESFGGVFFSANDFADVQDKGTKGPNGFQSDHRLAGDPANPSRQWAVAANEGGNGSYFVRTENGWTNDLGWTEGNPSRRLRDSAQDIAYNGGTVLMVGNSGQIMNSVDGASFFYVDDPANATTKWLAVGMASATDAIVGGAAGKLIRTTSAASVPDITPPTGLIAGPDTATAGTPASFTAQVADEAGGSGIDPAGFTWSSTGIAGATGQTAAITFPNPGTYTLQVAFRDLEGNAAQATKSVTVGAPRLAFPTGPGSAPTATRSGKRVKVKVKGKLTAPAGRSCAGKMRITVKRGSKRLARRTVKVKANCRYRKTLKVKRKKVGTAKSLKVVLQFTPAAGSGLAKSKITYTTKVT
jgi:photosystem II stability/assembly factor-like uncharacterized protein